MSDLRLTRRERQVMGMIGEGFGVREIAQRLAITPDTARKHRDNAVRKDGTGSQAAVVRKLAERHTASA